MLLYNFERMDRPYWYYNYVAFYLKIIIIVKTIFHMSCRCAYLDGPLNTGVNAWAVAIKAAKATVVDSFIVILFVLFYCFLEGETTVGMSYRFNLSWCWCWESLMLVEKRGCFFGLFDVHDVAMSEREIISREYTSLAVDFLHTSFHINSKKEIKKGFSTVQAHSCLLCFHQSKQITSTTERRRETRSNNKKRNNLARGRKNDHD